VELDGDSHYSMQQIEYDDERTERLSGYGLKVLRFTNADIGNNFYEVCTAIDKAVKERIPKSGPL
jgi:Uncharacterized protein conserved in bacteria